jgi:hypothetical protein
MESFTFKYQSKDHMELSNYRAQFMQEECCFYYDIVAL